MRKEHTKLCIASFVLGIVGLISFGGAFFILYPDLFFHFLFASIICGLLSTILGATSYFIKGEDSYGLAGLALGVIAFSLALLLFVVGLLIALGT